MATIVAEHVAKYLGGEAVLHREVLSDLDLAALIEERLPTDAVDCIVDEHLLHADELYDLVIPRRTLTKRRSTAGRLTTEESDRLVRVVRVITIAEEALQDRASAYEWLRRPNRALGGRRPIDLLATDNGSRLVESVLGRIEYGVYS